MAKTLDPVQAIHLVVGVISDWLSKAGSGSFNEGKTISGNPPKGYGMQDVRYLDFCAEISETLSSLTGRRLNLNKAFRDEHFGDEMGAFAGAVAAALRKAPLTASGEKLHAAATLIARRG